jgi:hypothetical protein
MELDTDTAVENEIGKFGVKQIAIVLHISAVGNMFPPAAASSQTSTCINN